MSTELVEYEETALARQETALRPSPRADAIATLATESEESFLARIEQMRTVRDRTERVKRELMREGIDYGRIPGSDTPTILKPGLEFLENTFRLRCTFHENVQYGDGDDRPDITVIMRCNVHDGDAEGPILATGLGASNSWEKKHRWRGAGRSCPDCGAVGTIRKSNREGWFCGARDGGCGTSFRAGDERIEGQSPKPISNPDPFDLLNTLLKMAEIRAHRNAMLRATASSGTFGSDDPPDGDTDQEERSTPRQQPARPAAQRPRQDAAPAQPAPAAAAPAAAPAQGIVYCSEHGCRSSLTKAQQAYSDKHYGRPLCPGHQKGATAGAPVAEAEAVDVDADPFAGVDEASPALLHVEAAEAGTYAQQSGI